MRHRWSSWSRRGHGGWDGTPTGVVSTRGCVVCGATEWRDSAVACADGRPRPDHGWIDAWGEEWAGRQRPECAGYNVSVVREEAAWEAQEHLRLRDLLED